MFFIKVTVSINLEKIIKPKKIPKVKDTFSLDLWENKSKGNGQNNYGTKWQLTSLFPTRYTTSFKRRQSKCNLGEKHV